MKIDFLGHSVVLIHMPVDKGETIILSDCWLSDYATGDYMARNPSIKFDFAKLPKIDAIYLSHPHCDHFDPYSLMELFSHQKPDILLPETSSFLKPLLEEYLNAHVIILKHNKKENLYGLTFRAFSFAVPYHTNEDDVMMLSIASKSEIVFLEVDAAVPDTEESYQTLYSLFTEKQYQTCVYVAVRNELEALFASLEATSPNDRKNKLKEYRIKRRDEMAYEYDKFEESDIPEIWRVANLTKIYIGQGMIVPPDAAPDLLELSSPFPLSEVVSEEKKIAQEYKRNLRFIAQEPGKSVHINGTKSELREIDYLEKLEKYPVTLRMDKTVRVHRKDKPVYPRKENIKEQKEKIIKLLNERFLPHQLSSLMDPLKMIVSNKKSRNYVIEVRYGTAESYETVYYGWSFTSIWFTEMNLEKEDSDERYWATDIIDFMEGRQDMFSTMLHFFPEGKQIRLWNMMGLPFLNSDFVYKKIQLHFKLASQNHTSKDWVMPAILDNISTGS